MPWVKSALEKRGFEVHVPQMPNTDNPIIESWVKHLAKEVGEIDENSIFIGHSIGCQAILRYLENLPGGKKCKRVILIAPWTSLMNLKEEEKPIAKPWIETPIDFEKVKTKAEKFIAVFSDDDPVVPYEENIKVFKEKLGVETITKHKMGHFTEDEGFTEIPFLLDLL
jgi:predicted alpha/beta hydrolase family esterase